MRQQDSVRPIVKMSVNGVATIFSYSSWVVYVPIGCRDPFMRYWQLSGANRTATRSLPHSENVRQRSINSFRSCTFGNQSIVPIFAHITELLTILIGNITTYERNNTDSKLIDIANCKRFRHILLVVEHGILIQYCQHTAQSRALYESIDGPAGPPADNPPNLDGLGVDHWTVPRLTVCMYW